ncbi:MAG: arginine--tRNA ligase [bacterium]|nr:arginine--tRNA ligase [bacterium]
MTDILDQAKKEIVDLIKNASGAMNIATGDLILPPDYKMGDLSFSCFKLAKELKKNPAQTAVDLQKKIKAQGLAAKIETAGPYLNFFLERGKIASEVIKSPLHPPLSKGERAAPLKKERVMVEFISPNNNKPLHLGHLRNAFLGESMARLLEARGVKVVRACLFNDRGLAIAKPMVAYKLWGKGKTPKKLKVKGDKFVGDLYVEFEKHSKEEISLNPPLTKGDVKGDFKSLSLLEEAEQMVCAWEKGDKATRALWKKLNGWALGGFKDTFKRLKLEFDISYFESALWQKGKKLVEEGIDKGIFKKDAAGAVVVDLESFKLPPKVMLRSNGTAIYSTTDFFLGQEKFVKNKLTRAIWCVGSEQDLYLKQLFAIYKKFGFSWADKCEHFSYGAVFLPEGKMKSREGKVVEADDLMDELRELVVEEIKARHKLGAAELKKRAEIIAQAALRFYLLSVTPKTIVHFNPKESISFTGHTGPYILYSYARIASILRKAAGRGQSSTGEVWPQRAAKLQISDIEWRLIFMMSRFVEVIREAADSRNPAILAQYLYDLAKIFSDFYEVVPILKAEAKERMARLALIKAVKNVMANGLELLTIEPVEKM